MDDYDYYDDENEDDVELTPELIAPHLSDLETTSFILFFNTIS